ncbi:MAG: hypothetical protein Q4D79_12025 [Propionibacteriaceae bacterium]|nr:hypothetical protein [Propionibacteriaceae bacterium]
MVPRLPRSAVGSAEQPPDYQRLARRKDALLLAVIVGLAAFALWRLPTGLLPLWFGYLGAGGALVWVDFKTTWLPKRLHWIAAAQLAAGLALVGWLAPRAAVGALLGAAAMAGVLWLVWRFSRTFGFGDVRLGLLVGAVAGSLGLQGWTTALLAGTVIGAVWAVCHAARGRAAEPFPYGPALWLGPFIAALVVA